MTKQLDALIAFFHFIFTCQEYAFILFLEGGGGKRVSLVHLITCTWRGIPDELLFSSLLRNDRRLCFVGRRRELGRLI